MKSKVLLIQPPGSQRQFTRSGTLLPPLGLVSLASTLRESGTDVKILDCEGQKCDWQDVRNELMHYKPQIVGITATSFTVMQAVNAAKIAKETVNAITVIGGPHASVEPSSLISDFESVDITVQNEGEITLMELVNTIETGSDLQSVPGIAFRKEDKIIVNKPREPIKNLDVLPLPAWDLLSPKVWKNYWDPRSNKFPIVTLQTNRGCPYQCSFCSESSIYGKGVRFKSAIRVVDEIQHDMEKFGVKELSIVDSIFTLHPKIVESICDEILSRHLDISWFCNSRVDTINESLLSKMKKAGCHRIYFGVESGTQDELSLINKKSTLSQAVVSVNLCKKYNVHVEAGFIIGLPKQGINQIKDTMKFAQTLGADSTQFSILLPLPGTAIYNTAIEEGLGLPMYIDAGFNSPGITLCGLSTSELVNMQKWAYRSVYFRPSYIISQLKKVRTGNIKSNMSRLSGFLKYTIR